MQLPKDPIMLLSFVNTQLRDKCPSLDDFVKEFDIDKEEWLDIIGASQETEETQKIRNVAIYHGNNEVP